MKASGDGDVSEFQASLINKGFGAKGGGGGGGLIGLLFKVITFPFKLIFSFLTR